MKPIEQMTVVDIMKFGEITPAGIASIVILVLVVVIYAAVFFHKKKKQK